MPRPQRSPECCWRRGDGGIKPDCWPRRSRAWTSSRWSMANRGPDDYAAAHRLGVSTRTLRRYTQDGRLPDARSAGGRRIFRIGDLDAITRKPAEARAVGYARVSSRRQQAEGDLDGSWPG